MIISFGECLIDFIPASKGKIDCYKPVAGGSPANVAVGIGRLDLPSGFAGGLSSDFFGDQIAQHFAQSHVDLRFSVRMGVNSTLAFVSLGDDEPQYAFFDENSANRLYEPPSTEILMNTANMLHFGSFSLGIEPLGSKLEALITAIGARRFISIDPNIRVSLLQDEDAYRARLDRILPQANLIKVSAADLEWLHPTKTHAVVADKWLTAGADLVVITQGSKGGIAFTKAGSVSVKAQSVNVVDTVGAGDSYMSGLLAYLAKNTDLDDDLASQLNGNLLTDMLGFAGECAAITVSRAGANPPYLSELTRPF